MKKLVIIDFQEDFYSPSGSLYVKGASNAMWRIEDLIRSGEFGEVIFTVDWHPLNHCSFAENGGQWPMHCLQHTKGALIAPLLMSAVIKDKIEYKVIVKGEKPYVEEYSAFTNKIPYESSGITTFESMTSEDVLTVKQSDEIVICGLAGDYCVLDSLKDLRDVWSQTLVYLDGIASIDGGTKINEFVKENNIKVYKK